MTTPKQALELHMVGQHDQVVRGRATHNQLKLIHKHDHDKRTLIHTHQPDGWIDGGHQQPVLISLAPPKNPSASRNGDRNWVLHIAYMDRGMGYRWELAGTRDGDADGAQAAAAKMLGWQPTWAVKGWGYEVKDGTGQ